MNALAYKAAVAQANEVYSGEPDVGVAMLRRILKKQEVRA
jgi:hypothetical protein